MDADFVREVGNLRRCLQIYAAYETGDIIDEREKDEARRSTQSAATSQMLHAFAEHYKLDGKFTLGIREGFDGDPTQPYADLVSYLKGFSPAK